MPAAEVAAYFARHRPQGEEHQLQNPQSDLESAAEVLNDAELEPATADDQSDDSTAGNGHSTAAVADTADSEAARAGDHEQAAAVPALTAESQNDAVLPSFEAVEQDDEAETQLSASSDGASDNSHIETEQQHLPKLPSLPGYEEASGDATADQGRHAESDQHTQQPADTRPSFADIQKVLDQSASQDVEAESEASDGHSESELSSDEAKADSQHGVPSQDGGDHEQTAAVPALTAETQDNAVLPSIEAVEEVEEVSEAATQPTASQSEDQEASTEEEPAATQPTASSSEDQEASTEEEPAAEQEEVAAESAPTMTDSAKDSTSATTSERPSAGALPRLPSLPPRRAAPSLPSRTAPSSGNLAFVHSLT